MLRRIAAVLLATVAVAPSARPAVTVGQPVPAFSVTTVDGQRVDIADLRGKRVLLFMWASW